MAAIAKRTGTYHPSMCSSDPPPSKKTNGKAGELLDWCDQLYLHTDGKYYKAIGAAANAAARVRGQAFKPADPDEACSVYKGCRFAYCATAQTPGIDVFLSGTTPGGLDTVATAGNPAVGFVTEDGVTIEFYEPR
jgi:hypothetical protein